MIKSPNFDNPEFLKNEQYKSSKNLAARIRLHEMYSVYKEPIFTSMFDQIIKFAPAKTKLLEIGTGRGDLWKEISHRIPETWDMTLTDISEGMIHDQQAYIGQELANRMKYEVFDAAHLPYDDDSFDVVVANYMLYHVKDRQQTLSEIRRVLKPDGTLFAATNGKNHMKRIYVLAQAISEDEDFSSVVSDRFSLQNGTAQLMEFFPNVHMARFQNNLWVTDPQPIIDYIASMVGIDGAAVITEKETSIRENLNRLIAQDGGILIGKETGMFTAFGAYEELTPPNN